MSGRALRPRPEGFDADARVMTQRELIAKYHMTAETMRRWLDEINFHRGRGAHKRPVAQYDIHTGELIRVWPSAADAGRAMYGRYQTNCTAICACCAGRAHTACGYIWKYWTGQVLSPEVLRKRKILARVEAFAKSHGRGWCGALAKATGYHLSSADVWNMHEAGKFDMAQWEMLDRALDKLEGKQ